MTYTRGQFATDVLKSIGNPNPSANTVGWVVAWTLFETGHPAGSYQGASYNLLNTTLPAAGATTFNSIGVKNYTSYSQGIQATADTLKGGYYAALLQALATNNEAALGFGQASPSPGVLAGLNTWCGSCGYGNQFVKNAGQFANESFSGTASPISGSGTGTGAPPSSSTSGGTAPPSSSTSGILIVLPSRASVTLSPNADVTQLLSTLDQIMIVQNPFDAPNIPTMANSTLPDPIGWLEVVGAAMWEDVQALAIRLAFLICGVYIILKVFNQFIDYSELINRVAGGIGQIASRSGAASLAGEAI